MENVHSLYSPDANGNRAADRSVPMLRRAFGSQPSFAKRRRPPQAISTGPPQDCEALATIFQPSGMRSSSSHRRPSFSTHLSGITTRSRFTSRDRNRDGGAIESPTEFIQMQRHDRATSAERRALTLDSTPTPKPMATSGISRVAGKVSGAWDRLHHTQPLHRAQDELSSTRGGTDFPADADPFLTEEGFEDDLESSMLSAEPDGWSTPRTIYDDPNKPGLHGKSEYRNPFPPSRSYLDRIEEAIKRCQMPGKSPTSSGKREVDGLSGAAAAAAAPRSSRPVLASLNQNRLMPTDDTARTNYRDDFFDKDRSPSIASLPKRGYGKKRRQDGLASRKVHIIRPKDATADNTDELR